nr:MAG TPA: hypothetical protein [Bacteriophage sp.]
MRRNFSSFSHLFHNFIVKFLEVSSLYTKSDIQITKLAIHPYKKRAKI